MAGSKPPLVELDRIRVALEKDGLEFKKCYLEASKVFQEIKSINTELKEAEFDDTLKGLDKLQEAVDDIINEAKKSKDEIKDVKINLLQEHRQVQIREQTGRKQLTDSGIGSAGFVGSVGISPERLSVPVQTTDEGQGSRQISLSGPSGLSLDSLMKSEGGNQKKSNSNSR